MKVIFDLPYDLIPQLKLDSTIFFLAQHYKEYEDSDTLGYIQVHCDIFMDNGAWDFKETMRVDKYVEVIEELKPKYVVLPDVIDDMKATKDLIEEFWSIHKRVNGVNYIPVLQGKSLEEMKYLLNWYSSNHMIDKDTISISRGSNTTTFMNRIDIINELNRDHDNITSYHLLGLRDIHELEAHSMKIRTIDTKVPIKYALRLLYPKLNGDYYSLGKYFNFHEWDVKVIRIIMKQFEEFVK